MKTIDKIIDKSTNFVRIALMLVSFVAMLSAFVIMMMIVLSFTSGKTENGLYSIAALIIPFVGLCLFRILHDAKTY